MSVSKIHFIFNERSGTVTRVGIGRMMNEVQKIMGPLAGEMRPGPGKDICPSVKELADRYEGQNHAIAIVAGDGGVVAAASVLMGRKTPLLPIAGGTHNIFVDQLGFDPDYIKSLKQALNHRVAAVDVGVVNGKPFLVGLALDPNAYNAFVIYTH